MPVFQTRLAGVELYFDDLARARTFYGDVLGLDVVEEDAGQHIKLEAGTAFLCLEKRGVEAYPSADKAVLFLEVTDLAQALERVGMQRVVQRGGDLPGPWAVLHDPEGHNVLLVQAPPR
jgi:predicted enzyme related to lactoylglutathione lyase